MGSNKKRRLLFFLPVVLFLVFAGIAGVFLLTDRDPRAIQTGMINKKIFDFDLSAPEGISAGLKRADLIGKVTLVNFFASWCTPCLAEHPFLMELSQKRKVHVVGINYKDMKGASWLKKHGNPFSRVGGDPKGRVALDWGLAGVPETFIVDKKGHIRFHHKGPLTPDLINNRILPLVERLKK
jgi:cytochrome c biogenesis protein CcmG/thiol:disulfide interchange protein DsbE